MVRRPCLAETEASHFTRPPQTRKTPSLPVSFSQLRAMQAYLPSAEDPEGEKLAGREDRLPQQHS